MDLLNEKRRMGQLKMEEAMDAHLKSVDTQCPELVLHYLFQRREISRSSQREVYRAWLFDKYLPIRNALDEIDHDQDMMVKHGKDLCGYLREYEFWRKK